MQKSKTDTAEHFYSRCATRDCVSRGSVTSQRAISAAQVE